MVLEGWQREWEEKIMVKDERHIAISIHKNDNVVYNCDGDGSCKNIFIRLSIENWRKSLLNVVFI